MDNSKRMCQRVICSVCNKITWTGCGRHVDEVMAGVSPENRCKCRDRNRR